MDSLALDLTGGIRDIFSPIFSWIKKSQKWISGFNLLIFYGLVTNHKLIVLEEISW